MRSIKTKLLISVGAVVCVFCIIVVYRNYRLISSDIERLTQEQVGLALEFVVATREYVAQNVRPVMYDLLGPDDFIVETMSSSFAARSIFDKVRSHFPDRIIKFSASNPRNPANKAGPEEIRMLEYFNDNPEQDRWAGRIAIDGRQFLAEFSPMRMEQGCLRCHGEPVDAPRSLLETYGSIAGFHRPLGKVFGLDTVAVPVDKISGLLWSQAVHSFAALGTVVVLLVVSLAVVLKFVITGRLDKMAQHFVEATRQDESADIQPIEIRGRDEIAVLADSFNSLAKRVNDAHESLEVNVRQRTGELMESNALLEKEVTKRKRAQEKLDEYHEQLRSLASQLSLAEERERRRIATEVHDRVAQNLAFAKMQLDQLRKSSSPESRAPLDEVRKLIDGAIEDARSLVSELGSPVLYELGLVPALHWLTQKLQKQQGINVEFKDDGHPKPLSDDVQVFLFQAARELLTNVAKHADAANCTVSLAVQDDRVQLEVVDDGKGFDPERTGAIGPDTRGFGFFSLRERLKPLGGTLEVYSKPGEGTRVSLFVPLHSKPIQ
jgi:signal transduction histidine kinase